jgi:3-phenylpropionate/trans-cinnamate dioxygenase ferredoxin subunit
MAFTKVATLQDIPPGKTKQVTVQGRKVGLFNVNGTVFAIEDVCTHRGAPLTEGECVGNQVICPWHGAEFDVTTGAVCSPPASRPVAVFKVQVVGDEVQVDV